MQRHIATRVHSLANKLQLIVSYIEEQNYGNALTACKMAQDELQVVESELTQLAQGPGEQRTHSFPKGSQLTVPQGTVVDDTGKAEQLTVTSPNKTKKKKK